MTAPYAFPTTAQLEHRGEESGLDVRAVLGFLRRRARLLAAVILVVNVAVTLVVLQVTPVYEATSTFELICKSICVVAISLAMRAAFSAPSERTSTAIT